MNISHFPECSEAMGLNWLLQRNYSHLFDCNYCCSCVHSLSVERSIQLKVTAPLLHLTASITKTIWMIVIMVLMHYFVAKQRYFTWKFAIKFCLDGIFNRMIELIMLRFSSCCRRHCFIMCKLILKRHEQILKFLGRPNRPNKSMQVIHFSAVILSQKPPN